ncbi:MAG: hypothetical protein MNPFHGCM_03265 [Gemmatimonadaceae bacterium]|nr:hypothetical protein [Gemmatimonadaceae bacterium]
MIASGVLLRVLPVNPVFLPKLDSGNYVQLGIAAAAALALVDAGAVALAMLRFRRTRLIAD